MTELLQFLLTIWGATRTIMSIVLILGIIYAGYLCLRGILPVLYRLGNGLARRKIAIFAKNDNLTSMKHLLEDSKLFRQNIIEVSSKDDLGRAEEASVYLIHWRDWGAQINDILDSKSDNCPMVVYAPHAKGRIPDDKMDILDSKRNVSVINFRGRLLNDIVTSLITTRL